jgi:hypothetical protein
MKRTTEYIRWFEGIGINDVPLVGGDMPLYCFQALESDGGSYRWEEGRPDSIRVLVSSLDTECPSYLQTRGASNCF